MKMQLAFQERSRFDVSMFYWLNLLRDRISIDSSYISHCLTHSSTGR